MKKIVMILIILVCIIVVFVAGINIVKPKISSLHSSFYASFCARIKEVKEYNGIITLLVEGLETNEINNRGEFTFSINDTKIFLNDTTVSKDKLKKGMLIEMGEYDYVQETYPARLVNVKSITIIQDELE